MKLTKILALAVALMPICATGQNTVKLTASKANDFGIAYTLPYTTFDIVIETEMTEQTPGEFNNYANLLLNATDAIVQPSYSATVRSVTVIPRGIPDEENKWLVEFKGSGITYMALNDAGVPIAINTEDAAAAKTPDLPKPTKAEPTPLETPAAKQAVTQEMTLSTSTTKKAQLAAQRIFELRDMRNNLISGDADNTPPDGKSMQLMLDNLTAQEAALTAMFVGTTRRWTDVQTLTYTPSGEEVNDLILARLSPIKGLVGADDLSGVPIYLTFDVISTGEIPQDAAGVPKKAPKDGVAYIIPGVAQLSISYNGTMLTAQDYEVAQLGTTFFLDPKIFTDKKAPAYVTFNPVTGGIATIGTKQEK